jgi:hypothetical protein
MHRLVPLLVAVLVVGSERGLARAEDPAGPSEAVRAARVKGLEFLRRRIGKDGAWGPVRGSVGYGNGDLGRGYEYPLGSTALCCYALLASGVPKEDPDLKKAFAYLDKNARGGVGGIGPSSYEASALLLAYTARGKGPLAWRRGEPVVLEGDDRKKVQTWVDWLLDVRTRRKKSGWRYDLARGSVPGGDEDLSSTGLAALALFAADRCGARVPDDLWPDLARYAMRQQELRGPEAALAVDEASTDLKAKSADAAPTADPAHAPRARGFAYILSDALEPDEGRATGGMTACGVATIAVARLVLGKKTSRAWTAKDQATAHDAMLDGCSWLDANWNASANPKKSRTQLYHVLYMLHVADALDLVGSSRLGSHAWYDEMSQALLASQKDDGSWNTRSSHEPADVLDTAFALLFFARPFAAPSAPAPGK